MRRNQLGSTCIREHENSCLPQFALLPITDALFLRHVFRPRLHCEHTLPCSYNLYPCALPHGLIARLHHVGTRCMKLYATYCTDRSVMVWVSLVGHELQS